MSYAWEKFYVAMLSTVGSPLSPQARLESVMTMTGGTGIRTLDRGHFPSEEIWGRYERLMDETKDWKRATDEEAQQLLKKCFEISESLAQASGAEDAEFNSHN